MNGENAYQQGQPANQPQNQNAPQNQYGGRQGYGNAGQQGGQAQPQNQNPPQNQGYGNAGHQQGQSQPQNQSYGNTGPQRSQAQPQNASGRRQSMGDVRRVAKVEKMSTSAFRAELVYQAQEKNAPYYKGECFYFFVTVTPGQKADTPSGRTYVYEDRITQKFSLQEMISFASVLEHLSEGNTSVLPYTKFSRSTGPNGENVSKQLFVTYKEDAGAPNQNNSYRSEAIISLGMSYGRTRIGFSMNKADAYGLGIELRHLAERGMDLEVDHQIDYNKKHEGQQAQQA